MDDRAVDRHQIDLLVDRESAVEQHRLLVERLIFPLPELKRREAVNSIRLLDTVWTGCRIHSLPKHHVHAKLLRSDPVVEAERPDVVDLPVREFLAHEQRVVAHLNGTGVRKLADGVVGLAHLVDLVCRIQVELHPGGIGGVRELELDVDFRARLKGLLNLHLEDRGGPLVGVEPVVPATLGDQREAHGSTGTLAGEPEVADANPRGHLLARSWTISYGIGAITGKEFDADCVEVGLVGRNHGQRVFGDQPMELGRDRAVTGLDALRAALRIDGGHRGIARRPLDQGFCIEVRPLAVTDHVFDERLPSALVVPLQPELLFEPGDGPAVGGRSSWLGIQADRCVGRGSEEVAIHASHHAVAALRGDTRAHD